MTFAPTVGNKFLLKVEYLSMKNSIRGLDAHVNVTHLDDSALMSRIAQGQEAALSELYDRYCRLVMSVAFNVVHNRETAEEVTLDIFTRVWEKAATYDDGQARVSTWLTRMARNRAIDRLRREAVRPSKYSVSWAEMLVEPVLDETNDPETAVHANLEQQRIRAAVASLSVQQQDALSLAYFQGYSHNEIAQALNEPLGTVKGRIRAGMQKLRDLLE